MNGTVILYLEILISRSFQKDIVVVVIIHACMRVCVRACASMCVCSLCRGGKTSLWRSVLSFYISWILGIELRSSGL